MSIQHRGGDAWLVSVYIGTEGGTKILPGDGPR